MDRNKQAVVVELRQRLEAHAKGEDVFLIQNDDDLGVLLMAVYELQKRQDQPDELVAAVTDIAAAIREKKAA